MMCAAQRGLRLAVLAAAVALSGAADPRHALAFEVDTAAVSANWATVTVESSAGEEWTLPHFLLPTGTGLRALVVDTPFEPDDVRSIAFSVKTGDWNITSLKSDGGVQWFAGGNTATPLGGASVRNKPVTFVNLAKGPIVVEARTENTQYAGTMAIFFFDAVADGKKCSYTFDATTMTGDGVLPGQVVVLTWWCDFPPEHVTELEIVAKEGGFVDSWEFAEVSMWRPGPQWCTMNVAGTTAVASAIKGDWPSLPSEVDYVCEAIGLHCALYETQGMCIEGNCRWSEGGECYYECDPHMYGDYCDKYCLAEETCSGKGRCDRTGKCKCQKGYGGADCNSEMHSCTVWGDPHYTTFSGKQFDFQGIPSATSIGTYNVYSIDKTTVVAQHYLCRGTVSRPKSCMEQIQITSVGGTTVTVLMGDKQGSENGLYHVIAADGTSSTGDASVVNSFPVPVGDIFLLSYREVNKLDVEFTFNLPAENGLSTEVRVVQERSKKDRLPQMALYISHFGSTATVGGLCAADCGKSDCTKDFGEEYATESRLPGPPALPEDPSPGCSATSEGRDWADSCCFPLQQCAGDDLYEQCRTENCEVGWSGSPWESDCISSISDVLLSAALCEKELCPGHFGGRYCEECQENYWGEDCEVFCDPAITCNGHGTCTGHGGCWCEPGYGVTDPVTHIHCQADAYPPATLPPLPTPAPTQEYPVDDFPIFGGEGDGKCPLFESCTFDPSCCRAPGLCMKFSNYYAQCREDCPSGWRCSEENNSATAPPKPEGCEYVIDFEGACTDAPQCCGEGLTCYEYSPAYAQCRTDCSFELMLSGWTCVVRS